MKLICFLLLIISFTYCSNNAYKHLRAKGYNLEKDTVTINPYEYLVYHKGYYPQWSECAIEPRLNVKISIKGYEDVDTIPMSVLKSDFFISLSDSTIKEIYSGTLKLHIGPGFFWPTLKSSALETLKLNFKDYIERRKNRQVDALFFFCVVVRKGNQYYAIPSRRYFVS